MKALKNNVILVFLILSASYQSCSSDKEDAATENEPTEGIIYEPLENLSEDTQFIEYLALFERTTITSIESLNRAEEIMLAYNNFEELEGTPEGTELAIILGFTDFQAMVSHSEMGSSLLIELNEKYNLFEFDWEELNPYYEIALENINALSSKNNTNRAMKSLLSTPPNDCFVEDEDEENFESWLCKEEYNQEFLEIIKKHFPKEMEEGTCTVVENFFTCSSSTNDETITRLMTDLQYAYMHYNCCVASSCESVEGVQDNSDDYCFLCC